MNLSAIIRHLFKPRVYFQPHELADVYALNTLYDYLISDETYNISFRTTHDPNQDKRIHPGAKIQDRYHLKNGVSMFSDISGLCFADRSLKVDISILKNCVKPKTKEEKAAIRDKYRIPQGKPIVVMSYSEAFGMEYALAHTLKGLATLVVVSKGESNEDVFFQADPNKHLTPLSSCGVMHLGQQGILKEVYATADAAVNCQNLSAENESLLHNFVEATEGGPLFMVRPKRTRQFGYAELTESGVIRSARNYSDMVDELMYFLRNFNGTHEHNEHRAAHLEATREKYLPVIFQYMRHLFSGGAEPETDLIATKTRGYGRPRIDLKHPSTDWDKYGSRRGDSE